MSALSDSLRWRDRLLIAHHELTCVCIVLADILDGGNISEPAWDRLALALQRLRALGEVS